MADKSLGGISWYVDADTSKATTSTKQFETTVNKTTQTLTTLDTKATKTAQSVNKGFSSMGRNAGQAGIQVQQFVGQIQGGQNAMLALSQQAADLGIVMGAPLIGVVVALAASFAGILLPSLFDSTNAAEELDKIMETLDKTITASQSGVNVLSNEYAALAERSKTLADATLLNAMGEIRNGLGLIKEATTEALDEFESFGRSFNTADFSALSKWADESSNGIEGLTERLISGNNAMGIALGLTKNLKNNLGITAEEALNLGSAMAAVADRPTTENLEELSGVLNSLATEQGPAASQALVTLNLDIAKLVDKSATLSEKQEILQRVMNGVTVASEEQDSKMRDLQGTYDQLAQRLVHQTNLLGKARSASLEYNKQLALREAYEAGASGETLNTIRAEYDKQIAYQKGIELEQERTTAATAAAKAERARASASRKAAQQAKADAKANKDAIDDYLDYVEDIDKAIAKKEKERGKEQTKAGEFAFEIITDDEDPMTRIQNKMEKLEELRQNDLLQEQLYVEAKKALQQQMLESQISILGSSAGTFSNAFGTIADTLGESLGEQSKAYQAMFALSKGFAVAQAGLNFSLALSQAMADPSAVTTAQKIANYATVAAAGASLLSSITSATYSGREHGGGVQAGQTYEVGEKNKPEMLMIPGNNGKVFSNAEMKSMMNGGGGGLNQTINNYAAADGYSVRTTGDGITGPQVVEIIKSEMGNPNSGARRGLQQTSNVHNTIGGRRR